ncbi:DNA-directed DNA polymerase [Entamoeba marina]
MSHESPRNSVDDLIDLLSVPTSSNNSCASKQSLSIQRNDVVDKRKRSSSQLQSCDTPLSQPTQQIQSQPCLTDVINTKQTEELPHTSQSSKISELVHNKLSQQSQSEDEISNFLLLSPEIDMKTDGGITEEQLNQAIIVNIKRTGVDLLIGDDFIVAPKTIIPRLFEEKRLIIIHDLSGQCKQLRDGFDCIVDSFYEHMHVFDTLVALSVIDPGSIGDKSFNELCVIFEVPIVSDTPIEILKRCRQLAKQCLTIMDLCNLTQVFITQEMPICGILVEMNFLTKFLIDKDLLQQQRNELNKYKRETELESSPEHVKKELKILGLVSDSSKKRNTTEKKILSQVNHPFAEIVLRHRKINKFLSGVVEQIRNNCSAQSGGGVLLQTTWNQTSIVTGRIQSIKPNLQQLHKQQFHIPEMILSARDLFIPRPNCSFVAADYNQIELRIMADFSNDENLINFFKTNTDVHKMIAAHWLKKDLNSVTDEERRRAKTIVYGCIYGIGPYSLADQLHVTVEEAATFLKTFLQQFPTVQQWKETMIHTAFESGFIRTLNNRRRRINHLLDNKKSKTEAERIAVNSPIQGSAADIIKMCMIQVFNKKYSDWKDVKIMLNIHDEIVLEVPDEILEQVVKELKVLMEEIVVLKVPLIVTIETGKRWGSLKPHTTN